jgi:hypothetical protein
MHEGRPQSGFVTAIGFYGSHIHVGHGSQGGWDIFGPERLVTRSKANILYELDGKPALALYKEYLGAKSAELPASGLLFPLQIRAKSQDENKLVRTILAIDEEAQSLTFAGDIPEGWRAQLMKANFDRLIDGASIATKEMQSHLNGAKNSLVIAISCVGRRLVLRHRAEEEVEAILTGLPSDAQQMGFYSYGEICPNGKISNCELHNQTMTLTCISED